MLALGCGDGATVTDTIDTHGMVLGFGKFAKELYTRAPISYLRWMIDCKHSRAEVAQAELDRRGVTATDNNIEISGHAIDSASMRCHKAWRKDRGSQEGLHAWLLRLCDEALGELEMGDDNRIIHKGVILVFNKGDLYWTLKTVMSDKRK